MIMQSIINQKPKLVEKVFKTGHKFKAKEIFLPSEVSLNNIVIELFPFDVQKYETDELEKEYWTHFVAVKDSIFPTDKGDEEDYTLKLDIPSITAWIERLKPCTESWGLFTLLLYGKYIRLYETRIEHND